ncbi:MAG TPA: DUF6270 domain-containing protein [Solirubrobacteraceae bacterium]|nr:DUF6270 domain-containing protein [Solirubrobacteraceae bacterium]
MDCMMRVGIFGSCVTRDLFEDPGLRPALARYTSRSSLISAVAAPVALDPRARAHPFANACLDRIVPAGLVEERDVLFPGEPGHDPQSGGRRQVQQPDGGTL